MKHTEREPVERRVLTNEELVKLIRLKKIPRRALLAQLERRRNEAEAAILEANGEQVPKTQQAFYLGVAIGGRYSIDRVHFGGEHIRIRTESYGKKRDLLKYAFGTKTDPKENARMTVYLDPSPFTFMENPLTNVDARFLNSRNRFAPFLFGLMASGLSDKQNRVSVPNQDLANLILSKFNKHYKTPNNPQIRLGYIDHRKDEKSSTIVITDSEMVLKLLGDTKSVRNLPFFKEVMDILSPAERIMEGEIFGRTPLHR